MTLGVLLIEWVYVVDLSGELLDESCAQCTQNQVIDPSN